MNFPGYSDEQLIYLLQQGDRSAFQEIFNRYWNPLYAIAYTRLKSREEAEEVVQELFTTLWSKSDTLLIGNLSHYLFGAVRKRVINQIRSKITHEKYWVYCQSFIPSAAETTEESVSYNELTQAIEKAIGELPEKSQEIFRLNRLEGRSVPEIAQSLSLSERAIEYHLTKSLRTLRLHLKDFMVTVLFGIWFF